MLKRYGENGVVAIKTVSKGVDLETFKSLLSEIKIMAYLGKHENIIHMIGASTVDIIERKLVFIPVRIICKCNMPCKKCDTDLISPVCLGSKFRSKMRPNPMEIPSFS